MLHQGRVKRVAAEITASFANENLGFTYLQLKQNALHAPANPQGRLSSPAQGIFQVRLRSLAIITSCSAAPHVGQCTVRVCVCLRVNASGCRYRGEGQRTGSPGDSRA